MKSRYDVCIQPKQVGTQERNQMPHNPILSSSKIRKYDEMSSSS